MCEGNDERRCKQTWLLHRNDVSKISLHLHNRRSAARGVVLPLIEG